MRRTSTTVVAALLALSGAAQEPLRDAPARKTVETVCGACHEIGTAVGTRRDREGWNAVVDAMVNRGARASEKDFDAIVDYLSRYYGFVHINKAAGKEIEEILEITADNAAAIVRYRTANGDFQDLESLKKVPGVDPKQIEERKDRIAFK
jgi:competence ComEA-like helix-hairpin-helix protein